MSKIGDAIKATRVAHGMTSRQLAEAVTLTPQYVRVIDCGLAVPSMETTLRIASVFVDQEPAAWLFLLLRDLWGDPIVDLMEKHIIAAHEKARD